MDKYCECEKSKNLWSLAFEQFLLVSKYISNEQQG